MYHQVGICLRLRMCSRKAEREGRGATEVRTQREGVD